MPQTVHGAWCLPYRVACGGRGGQWCEIVWRYCLLEWGVGGRILTKAPPKRPEGPIYQLPFWNRPQWLPCRKQHLLQCCPLCRALLTPAFTCLMACLSPDCRVSMSLKLTPCSPLSSFNYPEGCTWKVRRRCQDVSFSALWRRWLVKKNWPPLQLSVL